MKWFEHDCKPQQRSNGSESHSHPSTQRPTPGEPGRPSGVITSMNNELRYRGTWHTCKVIFMEEGWRGFYAGLGTNLIRAVPSAMTTILSFEYLKKNILQYQKHGVSDESASGQAVS